MLSFVSNAIPFFGVSTLQKWPPSGRRGLRPFPLGSNPSRVNKFCLTTANLPDDSQPQALPLSEDSIEDTDTTFLGPILEDIMHEQSDVQHAQSEISQSDEKGNGDNIDDNDVDEDKKKISFDREWYSVAQPISKPDSEGLNALQDKQGEEQILDLLALDGVGRQVLAKTSYESIVDVDIDDHGVLEDDEDNGELFSGVGLDALIENDAIVKNLNDDLGIQTATHVQLAAIPRVLDGRDIVMQSHTGTGKTLAFLLPVLDELDASVEITQAAVVAPTRELAMQISRECDRLIANTGLRNLALIGGANPARQAERLRRTVPHIVVGTPGRLSEMAEAGELRARRLSKLVIDEADQCLIGEFGEQVFRLLQSVPRRVQKVLVSATGDVDRVREFAGEGLHNPVLLRVGGKLRVPRNLDHYVCIVPARLKIDVVRRILNAEPRPERAIVFVDEPRRVDIVAERLWRMKIGAGALRGSAHKLERKEVLDALRKGVISVLVTTEVAARGLDVREMSHVINMDLPTDADHYVHRAGRCGRVGRQGTVINIATAETGFVVKRLARELGVEIKRMEPRGGEYREAAERSVGRERTRTGGMERKNSVNGKGEAAERKAVKQEKVENKKAIRPELGIPNAMDEVDARQIRSEIEFSDRLQELKKALIADEKGGDTGKIIELEDDDGDKDEMESKERKSVGGAGGAGDGDDGDSAGKMKKKKVRMLAKKAEKKAKAKAASKVERKKGNRGEGEEHSKEKRIEDLKIKRKATRDIGFRASKEGWVGNR